MRRHDNTDVLAYDNRNGYNIVPTIIIPGRAFKSPGHPRAVRHRSYASRRHSEDSAWFVYAVFNSPGPVV